jgi:hypothetical protein
MARTASTHPWIASLQERLDGLESALLSGDAAAVEAASAQVQAAMKSAPRAADIKQRGQAMQADMDMAAQRLSQLRQAVVRASAQNDRVLNNLLPGQAKQPTYGRLSISTRNGPGQAFLSA